MRVANRSTEFPVRLLYCADTERFICTVLQRLHLPWTRTTYLEAFVAESKTVRWCGVYRSSNRWHEIVCWTEVREEPIVLTTNFCGKPSPILDAESILTSTTYQYFSIDSRFMYARFIRVNLVDN